MPPTMIDYAVLCQAIADWKAGRAPTSHSAPETYDAVEEYDEVQEEEAAPEETTEEHTMIYQLPVLDD